MSLPRYITACLLTVAIETPCVAAFYPLQRIRMALVCAITTTITNLALNLLLPLLLGTGARFLVIGELGALVIEALVYWRAATPRDLARAAAASALANMLSFGLGLVAHV